MSSLSLATSDFRKRLLQCVVLAHHTEAVVVVAAVVAVIFAMKPDIYYRLFGVSKLF